MLTREDTRKAKAEEARQRGRDQERAASEKAGGVFNRLRTAGALAIDDTEEW